MLVQILAVMGAKIIATAGGKQKCELAKKLGAGWVVDSSLPQEEVIQQVKEITNNKGVDVVFDGVGKATFGTVDLEIVARKGTIIVFGNAVSPPPPLFSSCVGKLTREKQLSLALLNRSTSSA